MTDIALKPSRIKSKDLIKRKKNSGGYYHVTDGEWLTIPWRGFKEQCCSCAHIHKTDFRVIDGRLQFRSYTDHRATAAARKHFKFSKDE